jgi:2'-5' RNA ligase
MRLFIALKPGGETRDALIGLGERIKERAAAGNFSRRENLHLTLAFLGETPESQLPAVRGIIADPGLSAGPEPSCLNLRRTGCFRHGGKELWWIAPAEGDPGLPPLLGLRDRLAGALENAGLGFDKRPFRAHVTLGREIRGLPPGWTPGPVEIPFSITRLSLMKSGHSGGLLLYTEISGRDLGPPPLPDAAG